MKKIFLLIGLLFLFPFVQASAPIVDFNFVPTEPEIDQNIIFSPIITASPDLNVLTWNFNDEETRTYINQTDENAFYSHAFADGLGDWTVTSGTIDITDGNAVNTGGFAATMAADVNWNTSGYILFQSTVGGFLSSDIKFGIKNNDGDITDGNGYYVHLSPNDPFSFIRLYRVVNNVESIMLQTNPTITQGSLHNIIATRADNGNWRLFLDGVQQGGIFNDTNFSDFNSLVYEMNFEEIFVKDFNVTKKNQLSPININQTQTYSFSEGGNKQVCLYAENSDGNATDCQTVFVEQEQLNYSEPFNNLDGWTGFGGAWGILSGRLAAKFSTNPSLSEGNIYSTFGYDLEDYQKVTTEFQFERANSSFQSRYCWMAQTIPPSSQNNYCVLLGELGTSDIRFVRYEGGSIARNELVSSTAVTNGVNYTFRIEHTMFGNISFYLNGSLLTTINDTTYTDSSGMFFNYDAGGGTSSSENVYLFDNLSIVSTPLGPQDFTIQINAPYDERTGQTIPGLFNITIQDEDSPISLFDQALPDSFNFDFNIGTAHVITVVDSNADGQQYFPRSYVLYTDSNSEAIIIQPYLISLDDGVPIIFKITDITNNQTIPDIRVTMSTVFDSNNVVVEDNISNSAGIIQVIMIPFKNYSINVTSPSQDQNYFPFNQTINSAHSSYTFWINFFDLGSSTVFQNFSVSFFPTDLLLTGSTQTIDINSTTTLLFQLITHSIFDGNKLLDSQTCLISPCQTSYEVNLLTLDSNSIRAVSTITISGNDYSISNNYFVAGFTSEIVERIIGLKNELGAMSLGLISFVIVFSIIQWMGNSTFGNNLSQIFIIVIVFGGFVFFWFTDNYPILLGFLAALFGTFLIYIWSRNRSSG